jgi:hypothetical protein
MPKRKKGQEAAESKAHRNTLIRQCVHIRSNVDNIRFDVVIAEAAKFWGLSECTIMDIVCKRGSYYCDDVPVDTKLVKIYAHALKRLRNKK